MGDMERAKEIAGKLTSLQAIALCGLGSDYAAGPELPEMVIGGLSDLRELGLVERTFGDLESSRSFADGAATFRCSACWWFRLNGDGLAVRRILEDQNNG